MSKGKGLRRSTERRSILCGMIFICRRCQKYRPPKCFYKSSSTSNPSSDCIQCTLEKARIRYENKRDEIKRKVADYRDRNYERVRESARLSNQKYRAANKDIRRPIERRRQAERMKTDTQFRISRLYRGRVWKAMVGYYKTERGSVLVGCKWSELKAFLESKFLPGMCWDNYGSHWHIDHERPCALFDLRNPDEVRACFHFTNLQPLWKLDNLKKGSFYAGN